MRRWLTILKDTGVEWYEDDAPRLAASLAYYTLLSTAPLILLCVSIVGFFFGERAARGQISEQIATVTGPEAASAIQNVISNAHQSDAGVWSTILGVVLLLVGASGVFGELQTALNTMWDVKPKPGRGVLGFVRDRFLTFTMVLGVAFMLLASLVISAGLAAVGRVLSGALPGGEVVWQAVNFIISFAVITLLFALIFKVIPDVKIRWRDVSVGAAVTALLFSIGKLLLGLYLGKSTVASTYGAAGSIVAFVVWVYYASQILFLGAEFTQVYARALGKPIAPARNAISTRPPPPPAAVATTTTTTTTATAAATEDDPVRHRHSQAPAA
ncbi:MAG: YihY/virulence factor BrkB family protein [Polyangiales bacterium]